MTVEGGIYFSQLRRLSNFLIFANSVGAKHSSAHLFCILLSVSMHLFSFFLYNLPLYVLCSFVSEFLVLVCSIFRRRAACEPGPDGVRSFSARSPARCVSARVGAGRFPRMFPGGAGTGGSRPGVGTPAARTNPNRPRISPVRGPSVSTQILCPAARCQYP